MRSLIDDSRSRFLVGASSSNTAPASAVALVPHASAPMNPLMPASLPLSPTVTGKCMSRPGCSGMLSTLPGSKSCQSVPDARVNYSVGSCNISDKVSLEPRREFERSSCAKPPPQQRQPQRRQQQHHVRHQQPAPSVHAIPPMSKLESQQTPTPRGLVP